VLDHPPNPAIVLADQQAPRPPLREDEDQPLSSVSCKPGLPGAVRAPDTETYDYIVVGAGSAGAAVANRLSSDPRNKVLLLEAGRASHPWSPIPIGMARLIANPAANWLYSSEPEENTNGRRLPVPRGKLLGGSSSINGMVFVRGQAQDFDTWAQMAYRRVCLW